MTPTRSSLAAEPVESLLRHVGTLQGAGGHAPGLPQRTSPFAERMEDVERVVEVGQAGGTTAGTLEFHPLTQACAVVADHGPKCREPGEFLGPCPAITGRDHPPGQPAEALGLDDHQDRSGSEKISSAAACSTRGRAASSSTSSKP